MGMRLPGSFNVIQGMSAPMRNMVSITLSLLTASIGSFQQASAQQFPPEPVTFTTTVRSEIDLNLDPEGYKKALAKHDAEHAPYLQRLKAFEKDELPRHRQWACELAERFSGPNILPVLRELSLDVDGHVRKAA